MIFDKAAELVTTVAFDLGNVRPGPGQPIGIAAIGVGGTVTITMGATTTAADACIIVDGTATVFFNLPANTLRYIKCTFGAGQINVMVPQMMGQTNL